MNLSFDIERPGIIETERLPSAFVLAAVLHWLCMYRCRILRGSEAGRHYFTVYCRQVTSGIQSSHQDL